MRLLIDSLIALMLIAILGVVLVHHRHEQQRIAQHRSVHEALSSLYEQTLYHSVIDPDLDLNHRHSGPMTVGTPLHRFPEVIEPAWFHGIEPRNVAASKHPWVDVAPSGDPYDHPPDPILRRPEQAGFWYNPSRGVFRARVPAQVTEAATLDLYNRLNNCSLTKLYEVKDAARVASIPPAMRLADRATRLASGGEASGGGTATADRKPSLLRAAEVSTAH